MVVLEASKGDWPTPSSEFGCGLGRKTESPAHTGQENTSVYGLQYCEPLPWEIWGRTALPSECPHLGWAFLHPKTTAGMKGHRLYMWVEELRTVALGNLGEDRPSLQSALT